MGAVYSYMLYFRKNQLAEVLQGIAEMSEKHTPPTLLHFPDRILEVPIESWDSEDSPLHHDDAELGFSTVLIFDLDDAILDWGHGQEIETSSASNADHQKYPVSVGYIYLTIYNDLRQYYPEITLDLKDLALYQFSTTGARMSMMFGSSQSIRNGFLELLQKFNGVCGVFNNEQNGQVFWLNGNEIELEIDDPWLSPEEISRMVLKD
jgi:hypothetical protein